MNWIVLTLALAMLPCAGAVDVTGSVRMDSPCIDVSSCRGSCGGGDSPCTTTTCWIGAVDTPGYPICMLRSTLTMTLP